MLKLYILCKDMTQLQTLLESYHNAQILPHNPSHIGVLSHLVSICFAVFKI